MSSKQELEKVIALFPDQDAPQLGNTPASTISRPVEYSQRQAESYPYQILEIDRDSAPYFVTVYNKFEHFRAPLKELYEDTAELAKFGRDGLRQLATAYGVIHGDPKNSKNTDSSHIQSALKTNIAQAMAMIYCAVYILSNLSAMKLASVYGIEMGGGTLFFPLTYIIDDILTEVYGLRAARRAIALAVCSNVIVFSGLALVTALSASPFLDGQIQNAFQTLYYTAPKILLASVLSFAIGATINSNVLAKAKMLRRDGSLSLRLIKSTSCGVFIESLIFCFIIEFDFSSCTLVMPIQNLLKMIGFLTASKVGYELLMLPLICRVITYIKAMDGIDTFEEEISYNPFSMKFWKS